MKITYISEGGTVELGGGAHPFMNAIMLSGFGLPATEYETIHFSKQPGVTTTGSYDLPRTLTVTGDFNGGQDEIMSVLKSFYYPGELYCEFGKYNRKISCKCINMDDIERNANCGINGFTVQFQADTPYFRDFKDTEVMLASYRNHVTDSFTLPCVFTEHIQEGAAVVQGDLECYPTITITSAYEPTQDSATVTVRNLTTGAVIELKHVIRRYEKITINLAERTIISSTDGDITAKISDNTDLGKCALCLGKNELSFANTDTSQPITAVMTYNNMYLMAIKE